MALQMSIPTGSIVQMDWHSTAEGETVLQHFYNPLTTGRKLFGVLERPPVSQTIEEVSYKIFFAGKAGSGKTATIARLAGTSISHGYVETVGIRKTNICWPVKIWDKIILFKLQCWDTGENSIRKYSHILPSCTSKADAVVFVFSFLDRASFLELPQLMSKYLIYEDSSQPAVVVIGTRFNVSSKIEVSMSEIKEFEQKFHTMVMKMNKFTTGSTLTDRNEVHKMSPLLNNLCEKLWARDQEYLLKTGLSI